MDQNVQNAAETFAEDLLAQGALYDRPNPKLYCTTLGIIILLHLLFLFQWKQSTSRSNIVVTYEQIVRKKQFHKLIVAILSHPRCTHNNYEALGNPRNTNVSVSNNRSNGELIGREQGSSQRRPLEVDIGGGANQYEYENENQLSFNHQLQVLSINIFSTVKNQLIHPLVFGDLSGLPLLTYIAHILWQCRPLEEVYDYVYDSNFPDIHHGGFNVSAIIDRDMIIQNTIRHGSMKKPPNVKFGYHLEYYRVLFALILWSYLMEIIGTYLCLKVLYLQRQSESAPSSTIQNLIDSQAKRDLCTLTPMCIALLVIYTTHFPHTPVSVLPFLNTTSIFGSSSEFTFIACFLTLFLLSYRSYPSMGVFYGSITGLLWTSDLIRFVADRYWGGWCIFTTLFACMFSLKVEIMHSERISPGISGVSKMKDFFVWLDYICWDVNGSIRL